MYVRHCVVCVCVYMFCVLSMCLCMFKYACMEARGWTWISCYLILPLIFETVSPSSSPIWLDWLTSSHSGFSSIYPHSTRSTGMCHGSWLFVWVLGIWTQGPHDCKANTSLTKSSQRPDICDSYIAIPEVILQNCIDCGNALFVGKSVCPYWTSPTTCKTCQL